MSDGGHEANPDNPLCPICGAADWFSDPRWDYVLHAAHKGTTHAIDDPAGPYVVPVEGSICRVCRFVRLRSTGGTLELR
jgi:hypothetical protein